MRGRNALFFEFNPSHPPASVCATRQGLRLLLHPLKWCHLYVPLVPEVMVDRLIGCPTPFVMGLHRKTYLLRRQDFPADVVRVRAAASVLSYQSMPARL